MNGVNALENDDRGCLDCGCDRGALVQSEVIRGDLAVLARNQLVELLVSKIEIEGRWMIEVVVCRIIVLIVAVKLMNR